MKRLAVVMLAACACAPPATTAPARQPPAQQPCATTDRGRAKITVVPRSDEVDVSNATVIAVDERNCIRATSSGSFTLSGLPPGSYTVLVRANSRQGSEHVFVGVDETVTVEVDLAAHATVYDIADAVEVAKAERARSEDHKRMRRRCGCTEEGGFRDYP